MQDSSSPPPTFSHSYPVTISNEYSLFFPNCAPETSITVTVHTEFNNLNPDGSRNYLSSGQTNDTSNGWEIGFFFFKFIRVFLLFTLVFCGIIYGIVNGIAFYFEDWVTLNQVFLHLNVISWCAIVFLIVCLVRKITSLRKIEGESAMNLL